MADSFIHDKASNTLPKYRFQLFNPESNELITLRTAPIEWKEGTIEIKRDIKIGGVFTSFVVSSLTFIKEGRDFLNKIWNEKEFNGQCELIVSWFKYSTRTYQEMPTRFGLNFATAKPRVKVGKFGIGFLIDAQKSSILVKLENRRNKEVDITKNVSLGGNTYGVIPIKRRLNFGQLNQFFQSEWVSDYRTVAGQFPIANNANKNLYTQFDMTLNASEFTEANAMSYQTSIENKNLIPPFFENSTEDREVILHYSVSIVVTNPKNFAGEVYAVIIEVLHGNTVIKTERIMDVGNNKGKFWANGSLNLSITTGQSIRAYIQTDDVSNIAAYIYHSYFRLVQNVAQFDAVTVDSMPIYECFEKVLQHITDLQLPFYSTFFGRTDTPYKLNGDCYPGENQLRFANIMTGLNLRGAPMFYENNPLPVSFDKLFQCANSIWNIGYSEEFIEGFNRIVIDAYSNFFDNTEALDLSGRISIYDIETEAMPELAYSQIKSGFRDFSYEKINGRGEFNTEAQRSTILNTDSVLDIVSEIRGDTMGISEKIVQPLDTEDTEEDTELFIIKTQRDGPDEWKPEKEENIQVVNNTSLFAEDTMNLYFTPLRMVLRQANKIKGTLTKAYESYIRFQTSNKLQNLETTGEGVTIIENQDYRVNDLQAGIYKPIKHTVTCRFTFADFEAIMSNKKGYITFTPQIKGYLLSLKKKNDDDKATIEIIEKL